MNLMFRMSLLHLTNFINVNLSTLIICFDGYIISNVDLDIILILIKKCPIKYYKKVEI